MSLLRSTKFVRYFTGAARTIILNSAKTAEASLLVNPKALCCANNVVLRDYATSKKTETLEPLLQKLDSEVRRYGRIHKRDIDEVFHEIRAKNDITSSQSLLVIRCCGELVPEELPEQRTLLVQKIWNVLTKRGVPMDISHYNALLKVYLENEHPFSPAQFLEELEVKGLQPNRVTYQRLMWRYCQEGDLDGATKVLEKMRELNFQVSEPVLNALVMGHAFHGDTDGAKAVLETMAGVGLQPTNRTYTLLACGYAKQGDIEGVKKVIETAIEKDCFMTDRDLLEVIEHLALGGHSDKVEEIFPHLIKGPGYNQEVCNLVLKLLNKGHDETAKKVMKTMPKNPNAEDSMYKGAFYIQHLFRLNKPAEQLIQSCKDLQEEGLVPNAIYIATEAALQQGRTELSLLLFKELEKEGKEIRPHYYWPLLAQKGREGDEEGLLQILREMASRGIVPTNTTLQDYVIPHLLRLDSEENVILKLQIGNVPLIHGARNLMVELLIKGKIKEAANIALKYQPRGQFSSVARPLKLALARTKDVDSFTKILHVLSSQPSVQASENDAPTDDAQNDDSSSSNEIGRLVKGAVEILVTPDLCTSLLKSVHDRGLRISTEAAEGIQQYLGKNLTTELSELLANLTSADLEPAPLDSPRRGTGNTIRNSAQLEELLAKAKASNASSVTRLQKQLLMLYIAENNVDKTISFLEELKASNFEITRSTCLQLFELFCQNGLLDKAKEIEAFLVEKDPEFKLNKRKTIYMAYALVRSKRYDEAIEYLKMNKMQLDSESSSFALNTKCWQLLNQLADDKQDAVLKEITQILIENEYVEPTNVLLGPLVKVHLLKDDLESALQEFQNCTKTYRCTPWKGELMKMLIMKEDATKLQWLADLGTQIHGEVNILHDLLLAFVECGRLRQARRILETPGFSPRSKRFECACERYVEESKSEYLENLLEATKELSQIDRSNIFYHLLVAYCKADETDKALGLWTMLQEEGEVPSDQFLSCLGNHLKTKKRPVPFVIPHSPNQIEKEIKEITKPKAKKPTENKPTKNQLKETIESLVKSGNAPQAADVAIKAIQEGVTPNQQVLKFMLKSLAEAGNVEKIQEFGEFLNDNTRREITFDTRLTDAIFKSGGGAQHIDKIMSAVQSANTDDEVEAVVVKFPRNNTLATVVADEELEKKCYQFAEIAASKGNLRPVNFLWMEYVLTGKEQKAESLWKSWLSNSSKLLYRRLLQESFSRNQPELIEKLISYLNSNQNTTSGALGPVYSRLINMYLTLSKPNEAIAAYETAVKAGIETIHLNKSCAEQLKAAAKAAGKEINITESS